ncbi:hypothetical protein EGK14_12030 [Erwinia sp. 198]|nr:hypothetical protein EGK14_12030 [Erwinia sp. 198]
MNYFNYLIIKVKKAFNLKVSFAADWVYFPGKRDYSGGDFFNGAKNWTVILYVLTHKAGYAVCLPIAGGHCFSLS